MKKEKQEGLTDRVITELVYEKRKLMPRLGGKKLYHLLKGSMREQLIYMGRDRFFGWLRKHELLIRAKRRYAKTTNSYHRFRVHKNRIKEMTITRPDQCWVSDITYLRLHKGFCYLALITDAFSRKIIGYNISQSLELSGCIRALKMACKQRKMINTVHHSDRGIQYCSNQYIEILGANGVEVSMAEAGNCYENAMAERVNGILKSEFNLDVTFADVKQAQKAAIQAISVYNSQRPHMSIELKMPNDLYAA